MPRGLRQRPKKLAAKLKDIRVGLGLSQAALVERLGVTGCIMSQAEISDFEHGVREPDLLTLKAYARLAGVSVDDLIDDDVDLPKTLPGAARTAGLSGTPRKRSLWKEAKATMNTTTVMVRLQIKSDVGDVGEENRARRNIEKGRLKHHGMKKLKCGEYELTFSHQDETALDEQIYALIGAVTLEAKRRGCSLEFDARDEVSERHW
jgi:transcriptional regulator with XRE-family HTH domain